MPHPLASQVRDAHATGRASNWSNKDFVNREKWLKRVIEHGGDEESFYADLAERRLHKLSASI